MLHTHPHHTIPFPHFTHSDGVWRGYVSIGVSLLKIEFHLCSYAIEFQDANPLPRVCINLSPATITNR